MKTWRLKDKTGVALGASACVLLLLLFLLGTRQDCVLCNSRRYHGPCLVNLSTGGVGELTVYEPHPLMEGELDEIQQTGTFQFITCAGLVGTRDTSTHTCRMPLPLKTEKMRNKYFCQDCRKLLSSVTDRGFVLLDLYDLEQIKAYPIDNGAEYMVRDYKISVATQGEELVILVKGNLNFG